MLSLSTQCSDVGRQASGVITASDKEDFLLTYNVKQRHLMVGMNLKKVSTSFLERVDAHLDRTRIS